MTDFDASAEDVNITLTGGDDDTIVIRKLDENDELDDITGWTFWFTVKKSPTDPDSEAIIQKTITSHTAPTKGETEFTIENTETEDLDDRYWYDAQYKTDSGNVKTFLSGRIVFDTNVTQTT